ncbi:MAG: hypothetical protein RMZ41_029555 [Nostoc sp. DedVER02]|uniref:hypothetical protein n=1 Tax=unclassified Nostoc TaxID=2593658 RepID=UPI002AD4C088|nr:MULTISPECIES: hypothetical protein [unclassified Nostoc]MDZ7989041.1 hypothetical protein [Nostoc sp. DedVER02]MDZ8112543.1 hypothetical protein [Nostoc sp. DedVER01b]
MFLTQLEEFRQAIYDSLCLSRIWNCLYAQNFFFLPCYLNDFLLSSVPLAHWSYLHTQAASPPDWC